jgi:hypothetical protein
MTTLHYFYPKNTNYEHSLTGYDAFYAGMFPKGALAFKGQLDLKRFIQALDDTLQAFHPLFSTLKANSEGSITASYQQDDEHFITLETSRFHEPVDGFDFAYAIPKKMDARMLGGITDDFNGLPMAAFSLVELTDGFIFGYAVSHIYCDQSSIFYLLKSLSSYYEGNTMPAPHFINVEASLPLDKIQTLTLAKLRETAHLPGLIHLKDAQKLAFSPRTEKQAYTISITEHHFHQLKQSSETIISKNDITHAILLKCHALDPLFNTETPLQLGFACNMRQRLNLSEATIGNVLHFAHLPMMSSSYLREASITEIALKNREFIHTINVNDYHARVNWFKQLYALNDRQDQYDLSTCVYPNHFGHTNWTSFDYETIRFGDESPIELWTPPFPEAIQFTVSLFKKINNEMVVTIPIYLNHETVERAKQLSEETGAFEVTPQ